MTEPAVDPTQPQPPATPAAPPAEPPAARTYTEDEHKAAVEAAIKARFPEHAELKAAAEKLKAIEAESMTAQQKAEAAAAEATARAEAAEAKAKAAELGALKTRIGAAKGLPAELIARLSGDDEASITADADALAALVKTATPAPGARPAGNTDPDADDPFLAGLGV